MSACAQPDVPTPYCSDVEWPPVTCGQDTWAVCSNVARPMFDDCTPWAGHLAGWPTCADGVPTCATGTIVCVPLMEDGCP